MSNVRERLSTAVSDRYRIERELGAGGMATVYLAEDLKHKRKVALKVLKPELAAVLGAERFVQEITTTASLSHPHILPLFDSGEAGGFLYYVMPYIQGETIRERLNRETQFGIEDAVRITTEVADALDYAHQNGVIHRDIKPENILLHNGRPMVMDFGIALAVSAAAGGRMTETGLSLGTPHYMSPEQATAEKDITARSDIYSLASVLYEMLAGQPPHLGGPAQQVIMRIITETARPVSEFRRSVPANVVAALAKALEKLPADRFDSANAFARALGDRHFTKANSAVTSMAGMHGLWNPLAIGATIAATAMAAVLAWSRFAPSPEPPVTNLEVVLGDGRRVDPVLSPDGSFVLYSERRTLWRRRWDSMSGDSLGTQASRQAISPDGRFVVLFDGQVRGDWYVRDLDGGPDGPPLNQPEAVGWGEDGALYLVRAGALHRVRPPRWEPEPVIKLADDRLGDLNVLPGGRGILAVRRVAGETEIVVISLRDGGVTQVLAGYWPQYVDPGFVVYALADGALMAAPFDEGSLRVTGPARALGRSVGVVSGLPERFSIARNGTLLYSAGSEGEGRFVRAFRDGRVEPLAPSTREVPSGSFRLSPDGSRVAFRVGGIGGRRLLVKVLPDGPVTVLASLAPGTTSAPPSWGPDGEWVYYQENSEIWRAPADASRPAERYFGWSRPIAEGFVLGDGTLVFRTYPTGKDRDILVLAPGDSSPREFFASNADQMGPVLSPDGRWMAYEETGGGADGSTRQVFVQPFPTGPGRVPVSTNDGSQPRWGPGGGELFYMTRDGLRSVAATVTGQSIRFSAPRLVFPSGRLGGNLMGADYDVFPDGQSFLKVESQGAESRTYLVLNFVTELRRIMSGPAR